MREIQLTQGKYALVDDEDYGRLSGYRWFALKRKNTWHVIRHSPMINGQRQQMIYMHHKIIGRPSEGLVTDHKDGNGLNNQRDNLRHVTVRQNGQNMNHGSRSSKYPGVCWHKKQNQWVALIRINGPQKWLGSFETEIDAYEAYCQAVNDLGECVLKGEY